VFFDDIHDDEPVTRWALTFIDKEDGSIASHYGFFESQEQVLAYANMLRHGDAVPLQSKRGRVIQGSELEDYILKATPIYYVFGPRQLRGLSEWEKRLEEFLH
tara:strand:- start:367 stop:675 length:309 start_codon:yes stop_codon:yes gene_type:complete